MITPLTLAEQLKMRGLFLKDLPNILNMDAVALYERIGKFWSISYEGVRSYANREHMAKGITYTEFVQGLNAVVPCYIADITVSEEKRLNVSLKWEQHKEAIFGMAYCLFVDPEEPFPFPRGRKFEKERFNKLLENIKPVFMSLNPATAYKLNADYDLYCSVSYDDISFVRAITKMNTMQKEQLWAYLREKDSPAAGIVFEYFQNCEVVRWTTSYSFDFSKPRNSIENSWKELTGKATKDFLAFYRALFFLDAMWVTIGEQATLDENRFGDLEMKLFLLFKYFLASEWQSILMAELRSEQ